MVIWQNLHFLSPAPERDHTVFIEECVESAEIFSESGRRKQVGRAYFRFGYDYSILHERADTVLSVTFRLDSSSEEDLRRVMRENLLRTLSELTGYSFDTLSQETDEIGIEERRRTRTRETGLTGWDRDLLRALLLSDALDVHLIEELDPEDFGSKAGRDAFSAIRLQAENGSTTLTLASLGEEVSRICAGLMTDAEPLTQADIDTIMSEVEKKRLEREKRKLQQALTESNNDDKVEILRELNRVSSRLTGSGENRSEEKKR